MDKFIIIDLISQRDAVTHHLGSLSKGMGNSCLSASYIRLR